MKKERIIVSTITVASTLAFYCYGKSHSKDAVPYMIAGELLGMLLGEIVLTAIDKNKS